MSIFDIKSSALTKLQSSGVSRRDKIDFLCVFILSVKLKFRFELLGSANRHWVLGISINISFGK